MSDSQPDYASCQTCKKHLTEQYYRGLKNSPVSYSTLNFCFFFVLAVAEHVERVYTNWEIFFSSETKMDRTHVYLIQ